MIVQHSSTHCTKLTCVLICCFGKNKTKKSVVLERSFDLSKPKDIFFCQSNKSLCGSGTKATKKTKDLLAAAERLCSLSTGGSSTVSATGRKTKECSRPKDMTRKSVLKKVEMRYACTRTTVIMPRIVDRPPCNDDFPSRMFLIQNAPVLPASQASLKRIRHVPSHYHSP